MLEEPFEGRGALRAQLKHARVRTIDPGGSLEFEVPESSSDPPHYSNPVIARGVDEDQVPIEMLLLVDEEGRIAELDVWKGDGSVIKKLPPVASLQILVRV
jgi:hypothetical protein